MIDDIQYMQETYFSVHSSGSYNLNDQKKFIVESALLSEQNNGIF